MSIVIQFESPAECATFLVHCAADPVEAHAFAERMGALQHSNDDDKYWAILTDWLASEERLSLGYGMIAGIRLSNDLTRGFQAVFGLRIVALIDNRHAARIREWGARIGNVEKWSKGICESYGVEMTEAAIRQMSALAEKLRRFSEGKNDGVMLIAIKESCR